MASKTIKAWAVVADGHEMDAFDHHWVFTVEDEAKEAAREWKKDYPGVPFCVTPCTITIHPPKRRKA